MKAPMRSQEVIDKWAALLAARKSDVRVSWLLVGLTLSGMIAMHFAPSGGLFWLTAFVGFCFVVHQFVLRGSTLCPNCGNPPQSSFDRAWPTDAEMCAHCNHLLKD